MQQTILLRTKVHFFAVFDDIGVNKTCTVLYRLHPSQHEILLRLKCFLFICELSLISVEISVIPCCFCRRNYSSFLPLPRSSLLTPFVCLPVAGLLKNVFCEVC